MLYLELVIGPFTFKSSATRQKDDDESTARLDVVTEVAPPFGFCADDEDQDDEE
jgi:hypothetical protein